MARKKIKFDDGGSFPVKEGTISYGTRADGSYFIRLVNTKDQGVFTHCYTMLSRAIEELQPWLNTMQEADDD